MHYISLLSYLLAPKNVLQILNFLEFSFPNAVSTYWPYGSNRAHSVDLEDMLLLCIFYQSLLLLFSAFARATPQPVQSPSIRY